MKGKAEEGHGKLFASTQAILLLSLPLLRSLLPLLLLLTLLQPSLVAPLKKLLLSTLLQLSSDKIEEAPALEPGLCRGESDGEGES